MTQKSKQNLARSLIKIGLIASLSLTTACDSVTKELSKLDPTQKTNQTASAFVFVDDHTISKELEKQVHQKVGEIVEDFGKPGDHVIVVRVNHNSYVQPLDFIGQIPEIQTQVIAAFDAENKKKLAEERDQIEAVKAQMVKSIQNLPTTGPARKGTDIYGAFGKISDTLAVLPKMNNFIFVFSDLVDNQDKVDVEVNLNNAHLFLFRSNTTKDDAISGQGRIHHWKQYLIQHGAAKVIDVPGGDRNFLQPYLGVGGSHD